MSNRAIFLLLDVQQIFTPSKRCLVGSYFSATRRLVEHFYQTSSTKSSTRCLVKQKIWATVFASSENKTARNSIFFLLSFLSQFLYISTYKVIRMSNIVFGLYQKSNLAKQLESSLTLMFRSYYNDSTKNPIYFCKQIYYILHTYAAFKKIKRWMVSYFMTKLTMIYLVLTK